jgi:hypothetical protein
LCLIYLLTRSYGWLGERGIHSGEHDRKRGKERKGLGRRGKKKARERAGKPRK